MRILRLSGSPLVGDRARQVTKSIEGELHRGRLNERPVCSGQVRPPNAVMKQSPTTRILVVCSQPDLANAIRDEVSSHGISFSLHHACNREQLSRQLETFRPSLVLLGRSGMEELPMDQTLKTLDRMDPGLPVVVLGDGGREPNDLALAMHAIRGSAVRDQETELANDRLRYEVRQAADVMRESQKLVTIGRLAGSIAHEINNPLESVTNLLYLLGMDEQLSERAQGYLNLAQRELDRVAQIAKQTLNFYRDTPQPIRVQPSELIEEVLVLYARRIAEKQITVTKEFDTDRFITVSPGEMRQVFSNLITNAIEALERGGKLHLRVRDSRQWSGSASRGLRISIGDTGCGIGRDARQRLGQPFFTTKGHRGTGLGLWVTQSIVQRYGGKIQVSSSTEDAHHGTVFSIFLPVSPRPQSVVAINEPHGGFNGPSGPRSVSGGSDAGPVRAEKYSNGTS